MESARIAALLAPFLGDRGPQRARFSRAGVQDAVLANAELSQLATYLDLLLRWNARINLTAVRDPEQIVTRHFGESLFTARHLYPQSRQLTTGNWQLDLGSGAGFPGLPIKIWAPALRVTLIESQHRKAAFLREVIRSLGLAGIDVFPARAEEFLFKPADVAQASSPTKLTTDNWQLTTLTITLRAVEKFDTILPTAARLLAGAPMPSRRIALLIGAAQVPRARQLVPHLTWSDPIPIPLSSNRVVFIGCDTASPPQP